MSGLIFDENTVFNQQMYKYDMFLHSRVNKFTGDGKTLVTYWNINEHETTDSMGLGTNYQVLGKDSPIRYDMIENMILNGLTPLAPEEAKASQTNARNYALDGEATVIPGTIMPKENDMFIINNINMNHIFRVTQVTQDGLNTDGSYKIMYSLFSTNPREIEYVHTQTVGHYVMDLQTIGGEDLTPVIGKEDYNHRERLIQMVDDMIENYVSRYYDRTHNCFICRENGVALFDLCGNMFMARNGVMMRDNSNRNVILNQNKLNDPRVESLYQKSPYKWIERDAPERYIDSFKYHLMPGTAYPDSSFARYGADDVQVMIPNDPWCESLNCEKYFPDSVMEIFENEADIRPCSSCTCKICDRQHGCPKHYVGIRFDYVSMIHDFVYGRLRTIHDLSLYTGDQLFNMGLSKELYLWSPIIVYIIKQILKIK